MSTNSTIDQARDFLLVPPDASAEEVLQAARDRQGEWLTKLNDPRATARLKDGAARRLRELAPMLPFLEIEVQFEEIHRTVADPKAGRNQIQRLCDNVAQKINAVPSGEEQSMLFCRVKDLQEKARPVASPPVPPPPPPAAEPADPALAVFREKLADLRTAIDREDTSKINLVRMLAEANKAMSRLRDQAERIRAAAEIDQLERRAEALLIRATIPAVDFSKIVTERLTAASSALDRGDLAGTPDLLSAATEFFPKLTGDAHAGAIAKHAALGELLRRLTAEATALEISAGKNAALNAALAVPDLALAVRLLGEARSAATDLGEGAARAKAMAELGELGERLAKLEDETREQAKHRALVAQVAQIRNLLDRREIARAQELLGEVRASAGGLADRTSREAVLAELGSLARRLDELRQTPPPPKTRSPQAGQVLRLVPQESAAILGYVPVPLVLVARPRFIIGRFAAEGPSRADFSVPLTEKRVSRGHVTLSREGEEILIQDGDEGKKSSNGSKLDDESLAPTPVPASFAHERTISLGNVFSLVVRHLPTEAPGGPPQPAVSIDLAGGKTTAVTLITGCMKLGAKTDAHLPAHVVWLFSDASLGTASSNALGLPHSGLSDTHARIHFWQGAFLLENLRSGDAVRLGDHVLTKGEVAPLCSGDQVRLGQLAFHVTVDP